MHIIPRPADHYHIRSVFAEMPHFSHIIFLHEYPIETFFNCLRFYQLPLPKKTIISVGKQTEKKLKEKGLASAYSVEPEKFNSLLRKLFLHERESDFLLFLSASTDYVFPSNWLLQRAIRHYICFLCDKIHFH